MDFEIRRLGRHELALAVDVWVRARWDAQPWLEERLGHTAEEDLAFFRDVVCVEHEVWIAAQGAGVLGLVAVGRGEDEAEVGTGEIGQLHVAPAHQGQGVGSALLEKARSLFPEGLRLFTHQRNEKARRFYEARGFEAIRFGTSPPPENEPDVRYEWRRAPRSGPEAEPAGPDRQPGRAREPGDERSA